MTRIARRPGTLPETRSRTSAASCTASAIYRHDAIAVLASSELLYDFLLHEYDESYFYQKMRRVKKTASSIIAR